MARKDFKDYHIKLHRLGEWVELFCLPWRKLKEC